MEDKKRINTILLGVAIFLAYFMLGAQSVQRELVFAPVWARSVVQNAPSGQKVAATAPDAVLPYRLGDRFGYFSENGSILYTDIVSYNVALASVAWSNYPPMPDSVSFNSPAGTKLFTLKDPGYPYILNNRLYFIDPDRSGVTEYDRTGAKRWSRQYSSIITSMDATDKLTLAGLLDGKIVLVDARGKDIFEFLPGGSTIPVILGCAISRDGEYIAVVCGIDRERFLLLRRMADTYKVVYHEYLPGDFRKQVRIAFLSSSPRIAFEQEGCLSLFDIPSRQMETLPYAGRLFSIEPGSYRDFFVVLSESGTVKHLLGLTEPRSILLDHAFSSDTAFISQQGRSIYLGKDSWILKVDILEG